MQHYFETPIIQRGDVPIDSLSEILSADKLVYGVLNSGSNMLLKYNLPGLGLTDMVSDDDADVLLAKLEGTMFCKVTVKNIGGQADDLIDNQTWLINVKRIQRAIAYGVSDTKIFYYVGGPITLELVIDQSPTAFKALLVDTGEAADRYYAGNGTALLPSWSFTSDTNTGGYRVAADTLGFATNGTLRVSIDTTAVTSTLPFVAPAGSAAAPSYALVGELDSGMYLAGANTIGFSAGGVSQATIGVDGVTIRLGGGIKNTGDANSRALFAPATAPQTIAAGAGGAINVTSLHTNISTDAGGDAYTIADGTHEGQLKIIRLDVDGGGDATITPAHLTGGTTITMNDANDEIWLAWIGAAWQPVYNRGCTIA